MLSKQIGLTTAIFSVVASMIGTGIFVTTGDILAITQNSTLVLLIWLIGGGIALCGALSYAELATMMPKSGGEYIYLQKTFGQLPSFLSGWVSLIVGFSASIALSTLALQLYMEKFLISLSNTYSLKIIFFEKEYVKTLFSFSIVIFLGFVHFRGIRLSIRVQNGLASFKIMVMVIFIVAGFSVLDFSQLDRLFVHYSTNFVGLENDLMSNISRVGTALLIVTFAYSGWNGASYIAEEIKNPQKNLPRSLCWGTVITIIFYIFSNILFLLSMKGEDIMKTKTIGEASAQALFPENSALVFNFCILIVLLSSISIQMMIGPRVYYAMAKDRVIFNGLAKIDKDSQTPQRAILLQMSIVLCYILFDFDLNWLMTYMGFALSIFPFLTVSGLFYLRWKHPHWERPYRVTLYPVVPLLFLIGSATTMLASLFAWTWSSIVAIIVVSAGVPVFFIWQKTVQKFSEKK